MPRDAKETPAAAALRQRGPRAAASPLTLSHQPQQTQTKSTTHQQRINPPTPRQDFTFVCPTEIVAFSDRIKEFEALNCAVVGCSVDSHFSHLAWVNTPRNKGGLGGTGYPLLADLTKQVARDYEVLIEDGADAGVALR